MGESVTGPKISSMAYIKPVVLLIVFVALAALIPLALGLLHPATYFGLMLGLILAGLFVIDIRIFILVYIAVRGLMEAFLGPTRISVGGLSMQMLGVLGAAILFGGFIYIIVNKVKIWEVSVVGPMLIFLFATLPVTLTMSEDKMSGFKDWVGTASTIVLFILIAELFANKRYLKMLLAALVTSTIPPLAMGFYQFVTDTGNHDTPGFNRIFAAFPHPNAYATYLMMILLLCIPLLIETRVRWQRIVYVLLCGAMLFSLIYTYARAAWVDVVAGLLVVGSFRYRKMLLLVPAGIIILLLLVPSILERFQEALGFSQGQGSMFFRVEMWRYLLSKFYASPIVGNGLGSYGVYAEEGLGYYYMPHNDYVHLLVDSGVIGLGCYLAAIFGVFRGAVRSYFKFEDTQLKILALAMIAVVISYLLGSITDNLFRAGATQTYFWAMAGLVAAATRMTNTQEQEQLETAGQYKLASVET